MQIDIRELFGDISQLDKKILQSLFEAIKDNHSKDFDYLKFKKSILNLQEMDIDESTSIKSAYSTATTMGLNKTGLIKSAKKYQSVLVKEKEVFAETLQRQMQSKVQSKIEEKEEVIKAIATHKRKIEQLTKEVQVFEKKLENVDHKVVAAKAKIATTRDKFVAAYDQIYGTVAADAEKWDNIL